MTDPQLTYGIDRETEKLVHISDAVDERVYLCPKCREELILYNHWSLDRVRKPGQRKQHFYAHKPDSQCKGARMTALHLLAQEILEQEKSVMLPGTDHKFQYTHHEPWLERFDSVENEKLVKEGEIKRRPDCIGYKNGEEVWIEIFVHHAVDEDKEYDIRALGKKCVEINLQQFLDVDFTRESVAGYLLHSSLYNHWIYNPEWEEEEKKHKEKLIQQKKEQAEKLKERKLFLETLIQRWEDKDVEATHGLLDFCRANPTSDELQILKSKLCSTFLHYIKTGSLSEDGLTLFRHICFDPSEFFSWDTEELVPRFRKCKSRLDKRNHIALEEIALVNCGITRNFDNREYIQSLIIYSVFCGHPIGVDDISTLEELSDYVIDNIPELSEIYRNAILHTKSYPDIYTYSICSDSKFARLSELAKTAEYFNSKVYSAFDPMYKLLQAIVDKQKHRDEFRRGIEKGCPQCGGSLVLRTSKFGKFYGCTNYPSCNYKKNIFLV